jgi:hypothetical protein
MWKKVSVGVRAKLLRFLSTFAKEHLARWLVIGNKRVDIDTTHGHG